MDNCQTIFGAKKSLTRIRINLDHADPRENENLQHHFQAVFRIREILVRIRKLGSVPLTIGFGSGSGSCSFRVIFRQQQMIFSL